MWGYLGVLRCLLGGLLGGLSCFLVMPMANLNFGVVGVGGGEEGVDSASSYWYKEIVRYGVKGGANLRQVRYGGTRIFALWEMFHSLLPLLVTKNKII